LNEITGLENSTGIAHAHTNVIASGGSRNTTVHDPKTYILFF